MTKAEVVNTLAKRTGMPRKEAAEAVEIFLDAILEALQRGDKVSLVGFGTFYVKEKNSRQGRNPRSGAKIQIPRKRVASFKPGKAFRDLVNRSASRPAPAPHAPAPLSPPTDTGATGQGELF